MGGEGGRIGPCRTAVGEGCSAPPLRSFTVTTAQAETGPSRRDTQRCNKMGNGVAQKNSRFGEWMERKGLLGSECHGRDHAVGVQAELLAAYAALSRNPSNRFPRLALMTAAEM
jgi:hypothetical protein